MRASGALLSLVLLFGVVPPAAAQDPPPRIPLFVVDVHAVVPMFPSDSVLLAASRGLSSAAQLPGSGLGGDIAVHIFPLRWRAVTFGLGGNLMTGHSRLALDPATSPLAPVTERFTSIAPQVSFNFGTGLGWSYISGGMSTVTWTIIPDGSASLPVDDEKLKTINYGGGARWFIKPHVAFSLDVRFYAINPSAPHGILPSTPRTTLIVIGAGVSLK